MHGNAGCKLEGESYAHLILPLGINLFSFDFSGCGNSEGEYVTLGGAKERGDLSTVVRYLRGLGTVGKIGLWGRSMGAATAIMYLPEDQHLDSPISAGVFDSSFTSVSDIIDHIAKDQLRLHSAIAAIITLAVKA